MMEYQIGIAVIAFVVVILQLALRDKPDFLVGYFGEKQSGHEPEDGDPAEGDTDCGDPDIGGADCGDAGGFDIGGLF